VKIINNTEASLSYIEALPIVGKIKNNWRERNVTLHARPNTPDMLYMIGVSFDNSLKIVTYESIGMNEKTALDYWIHGQRVLVRD
jgi:hypothetical protein